VKYVESNQLTTALIAMVIGLTTAGAAQAIDIINITSANAVSYCQAALPVFDVQLRKRPLAVVNEGDASAFVTCAFTRHGNSDSILTLLMFAQNTGANSQDLTCTLVAGVAGAADNQLVVKTVTLPPGQPRQISWTGGDFSGGVVPDTQYSMSCSLPPGIGLNDSYLSFFEDIGQ